MRCPRAVTLHGASVTAWGIQKERRLFVAYSSPPAQPVLAARGGYAAFGELADMLYRALPEKAINYYPLAKASISINFY